MDKLILSVSNAIEKVSKSFLASLQDILSLEVWHSSSHLLSSQYMTAVIPSEDSVSENHISGARELVKIRMKVRQTLP